MKSVLVRISLTLPTAVFFMCAVNAQQRSLEEASLSSFDVLDIRGPFSVELVPGDKTSISIDMDEKYKGLVQYAVSSDVLSVKWNGQTRTIPDDIKIRIGVGQLSSLTLNATGAVSCAAALKAKTLNIVIMGSTPASLLLDAERVDMTTKGNARAVLSGKVNLFSLFNYGNGNIDAAAFQAKVANLLSSGEGDVSVYASAQLGITATGTGTIKYYGLPGKLKISNAKNAMILNGQES